MIKIGSFTFLRLDNLGIHRDYEVIQIASQISTMSTMSTITTAWTLSIMSTVSTTLSKTFWDPKAFFEIPKHFWDPKAFLRSKNNLKTWILWTLIPLVLDLKIAPLAHHLRPIFGLVFFYGFEGGGSPGGGSDPHPNLWIGEVNRKRLRKINTFNTGRGGYEILKFFHILSCF